MTDAGKCGLWHLDATLNLLPLGSLSMNAGESAQLNGGGASSRLCAPHGKTCGNLNSLIRQPPCSTARCRLFKKGDGSGEVERRPSFLIEPAYSERHNHRTELTLKKCPLSCSAQDLFLFFFMLFLHSCLFFLFILDIILSV